jgi:membrane-associated phospholipid phosphatase
MARDDLDKAVKSTGRADARAASAMAPFQDIKWLEPVSDLGDQPQLRTLAAAAIAAGLAAGRRAEWGPRLARAGVRMLIAHQLATMAKNFVKHRVDRTRPRSRRRPGKDHRIEPGRKRSKEETSFPSGHAAGAAAVARAFAREFPEHRGAAAAAGGALALVQVPRCAHYPTDIAAGIAIGLCAEALVAALWPAPPPCASGAPTNREYQPCEA